MGPIIVKEKIAPKILQELLDEYFEIMVKIAVDIEKEICAAHGEWHSFGQEILADKKNSDGSNVWGANFYPQEKGAKRIEYVSLINIKPAAGNRSIMIEDGEVRKKVKEIAEKLILGENEEFSS